MIANFPLLISTAVERMKAPTIHDSTKSTPPPPLTLVTDYALGDIAKMQSV